MAVVNVAPFGSWRLIAVAQAPPQDRRHNDAVAVREGGGVAFSLRDAHGIRTRKPSPGRTVSGEMPALDGAKCYTGNGDAPLALRLAGRARFKGRRVLFLEQHYHQRSRGERKCKRPDESRKTADWVRKTSYGMQVDARKSRATGGPLCFEKSRRFGCLSNQEAWPRAQPK
jgi:hypothetical protein